MQKIMFIIHNNHGSDKNILLSGKIKDRMAGYQSEGWKQQ